MDCYAGASCSDTSFDAQKGRLITTGELRYSLLAFSDGEICIKEATVPFRYECDCEAHDLDGDLLCSVAAEVVSTRWRPDGGRIGLDSELALSLRAVVRQRIRAVSSLELGDPLPERRAAYTVCYPCRSDTLWTIAKKYCVSRSELLAKNPDAQTASLSSLQLII